MKSIVHVLAFSLAGVAGALAQGGVSSEFQPASPQQGNTASAPAKPESTSNAGGSTFLGKDVPMFDPDSETISWDGKNWNVSNNRIFGARFEKYLNAPPANTPADEEYSAILKKIMQKLAPGSMTPKSTDEAFQLLAKASEFQQDAHLCDSIANQVYASWLTRNNSERMIAANKSLEAERKRLEWNAGMAAQTSPLSGTSGSVQAQNATVKRDMELQPIVQRIAEVNALLKKNQLTREVAQLQVKIEFQALILQQFLQRRFQHVVISTQFYRSIFNDGDSQLRVGEDAQSLFSKTSGLPPTLGTVDSMATEVMRDVHEGIDSFNFLLEEKELESASKRLAETFLIGEYMPAVRTLSRAKKREVLSFVQKSNQLISAIEVKDYELADKLVKEMKLSAKDFDSSKPVAVIETSKAAASMHIAKARNAAVSGDKTTLEAELKSAMEIWPRNPALAEVSGMIFKESNVQAQALMNFEQLVSQKNYRQIYDDQMKFIAATAMYPDKQEELRKILERMGSVEKAIIQAQEIEKRGDYAGAWEAAERQFRQFGDDNKLNQVRANLTTEASDFVHALKRGETLEEKQQWGSSLAWYLKAQEQYPASEFAKEGIQRLTKRILPDAG